MFQYKNILMSQSGLDMTGQMLSLGRSVWMSKNPERGRERERERERDRELINTKKQENLRMEAGMSCWLISFPGGLKGHYKYSQMN